MFQNIKKVIWWKETIQSTASTFFLFLPVHSSRKTTSEHPLSTWRCRTNKQLHFGSLPSGGRHRKVTVRSCAGLDRLLSWDLFSCHCQKRNRTMQWDQFQKWTWGIIRRQNGNFVAWLGACTWSVAAKPLMILCALVRFSAVFFLLQRARGVCSFHASIPWHRPHCLLII